MTQAQPPRFVAHCVAPPLTDEHINEHFPSLLESLPPQLQAPYSCLLRLVTQHRVDGSSVNLPARRERDIMATQFDVLPHDGPHRTPAFHLLWYVNELAVGRCPPRAE